MSLETRLVALAQSIGTDIKSLKTDQGTLSSLNTTTKTSLVAAINELIVLIGSAGASINDSAGNGDTTVTWSADKIFDSIEAAKTAIVNQLTDGAAEALNTLSELATALNNDPNFATTIATEISNRVRYDAAQTLTAPQQAQARTNIGAVSTTDVGNTDRDFVADYTTAKA